MISLKSIFAAILVLSVWPGSVSAQPSARSAAPKLKINPPPSAELAYTIKARQSGLDIGGNAILHWTVAGKNYSVAAETRAMLVGKILDERSQGVIDSYGLAPMAFSEKRFRRDPTTTTFDRGNGSIVFSHSPHAYPIKGGEQDRASALWQLISIARAMPSRFKPESKWTFFVAGHEDADPWTFKIGKQEKIRTALGEMNALHVLKDNAPNAKGRRLDIWLAPGLEWYPVKLRYTEGNGEYIEQTLESIVRK